MFHSIPAEEFRLSASRITWSVRLHIVWFETFTATFSPYHEDLSSKTLKISISYQQKWPRMRKRRYVRYARAKRCLALKSPNRVQRLKSALWFSIGKIVDEETLKLGVNATPQFIGALTEMVWAQIGDNIHSWPP